VFIDHVSFHDAFCADVPVTRARVVALTQRRVAVDASTSVVTGTPAWQSLPSWAVVATTDHAIHPDAEHDMAKRAAAEVVELDAPRRSRRPAGQGRQGKGCEPSKARGQHDNDDLFGQPRREQAQRDYRPQWLDNLANDATIEGLVLTGTVEGPEAIRAILGFARQVYDCQEFNYAGRYGDDRFVEDYTSVVRGEPIGSVAVMGFNEAGHDLRIGVNHRPLRSVLLWSQLMGEDFAGTPYAQYVLSHDAAEALHAVTKHDERHDRYLTGQFRQVGPHHAAAPGCRQRTSGLLGAAPQSRIESHTMTIAMIGATGRVGSEIVRGLLAPGAAVTALVRDPGKAHRAY
jgi:hypothetical protein